MKARTKKSNYEFPKATGPDLSRMTEFNLLHVSFGLKNRVAAPSLLCREVGTVNGRFYLLDFSTNKIERITYGAFKHLSEAWKAYNRWAETI